MPFGEKRYRELRPTLAIAPPSGLPNANAPLFAQNGGCIDLDGTFGLNNAMQPLKALWDKRVFPGMAPSAVGGFGAEAKEAVPRLIELLAPGEHPDMRWTAAFALAQIGPDSKEAVPTLAEGLSDMDEKVRWYSAFALSEIGADSVRATAALIQALDDFDDDVRGYATRALGRIGAAAKEA